MWMYRTSCVDGKGREEHHYFNGFAVKHLGDYTLLYGSLVGPERLLSILMSTFTYLFPKGVDSEEDSEQEEIMSEEEDMEEDMAEEGEEEEEEAVGDIENDLSDVDEAGE